MSISGIPINERLVHRAFVEIREIMEEDCFSMANRVRTVYNNLTPDEQIELNNRLREVKIPKKNGSGTRQLNTLLRTYLEYYDE